MEPFDVGDTFRSRKERFFGSGSKLLDFEFEYFEEFQDLVDFINSSSDLVVEADGFREGISQAAYFDSVFQKSRPTLYGDKYKEGPPSQVETQEKPGRETERTEFFAGLGSVEELKYFMFKMKRVLHSITDTTTESTCPSFGFHNFSVSEEFRLAVLSGINSQNWEQVESLIMPIAAAFPGRAAIYDAFVIAAALLLSVVYQYLIGLGDRGGGRTYSRGSLGFRSIYISIVLFQGAYVWIKFRDVAPESEQHPPRGVYRKSRVNEVGVTVYYGNYEPRFKPPGSKVYISVGSYELKGDATNLYQILAFYYGKKDVQGELPLLDDSTHPIPPMTEEERRFDPEKKKEWVKGKAKAVLEEYKGVMDSIFMGCFMDLQPTEDFVSTVPLLSECPDAGAAFGGMEPSGGVRAEAHPFLGNQAGDDGGDDVQSAPPDNCIPNEGPVIQEAQHHMGSVTLGGNVVGNASHSTLPELSMRSVPDPATNSPAIGAAVSREQPLEFQPSEIQLYHRSWQENQVNNSAINVIPDDLSLRRQVNELRRQLHSEQLRNEQLESRISASEQQHQLQELRSQQLESRFLQFQQQQQLQQPRREQRQQLRNEQLESRISALEGELEHFRSPENACKRSCFGLRSQN